MNSNNGRYKFAPNGFVKVLKPEEAAKRISEKFEKQKKDQHTPYIPRDNEINKVRAARKAGLPVALVGPPGIGKTTLITNIAKEDGLALTTIVGDERARLYQIIGSAMDMEDEIIYNDSPVGLAARAGEHGQRSILYIDEAFNFPADVYTSLSSMLDHRKKLFILETGEELDTQNLEVLLSFNPPPLEDIDKLPRPATLDRMVFVRFQENDGNEMLRIAKLKHGIERISAKRQVLDNEIDMHEAIESYGKKLAAVVDDLNRETGEYSSIIIKKTTDRSFLNTLSLICSGLVPEQAIDMAMIQPMVPVDDDLVPNFIKAAEHIVKTHFGVRE